MKRTLATVLISFVGVLGSAAFASHFTGTYQDQARGVTLVIQHGPSMMQGVMLEGSTQMQLLGQGDERGAQGVLKGSQNQFGFQAQLSPDGGTLELTLQQLDPQGQPVPGGATQQFSLQRVSYDAQLPGSQPPGPQPPAPQPPTPGPTPQPPTPQPPLSQQPSDPWSGVYTGNAGQLTVVVQAAAPGGWGGYIELSGTQYPFQALGDASYLEGSFQSPNGSFTFALEQSGGSVNLYSGDVQYVLERQNAPVGPGPAPAGGGNPLGNP